MALPSASPRSGDAAPDLSWIVTQHIMQDKSVSVSLYGLATLVAWSLVGLLVATFSIVGTLTYGVLACSGSALAATLSVRGFCCRLAAELHNAFELGRDAGRAEVRPMVRR